MASTKSHRAIMTVIRRHWTIHALWRFREHYNLDDDDPDSLIDLADRMELKDRPLMMVLELSREFGSQQVVCGF
ncbi:hypothetical protein [Microvirga sp. VF16]|uniref:hypothetical protein n=1 Tax=Microvirga sp. VF16 TaxID=2807101 RepID=UPI00193EC157|nr:hypothetical protein [Microvirga sp. VF16]QRM33501.1 hypothetical protein JO965_36290 [Microvirga sp. VF16]